MLGPVAATAATDPHAPADNDRHLERLADAARTCSRLAHDLDNVLTGILGFAELAHGSVPTGHAAQNFLTELRLSAETSVQFADQLHEFGRAGQSHPGPCRTAEVLRATAAAVRFAPTQEIIVTLAEPLPDAAISADKLRQVVGHLLANAAEALGDQPGRIELTAKAALLTPAAAADHFGRLAPGRALAITVTDTGPGWRAEVRRRVPAEPFLTTKPRHRGLGLPTVYRVAAAHAGGLRIDDRPGGGATATLALPIAGRTNTTPDAHP